MFKERFKKFLVLITLAFSILFLINFVPATFVDCQQYESQNKAACNAGGCIWASDDSSEVAINITDIYDPFCNYGGYCCFPNRCWQFDGDNESCINGTSALGTVLNCTWDPFMTIYAPPPNNSLLYQGGCMGTDDFMGMNSGCWNSEADKASCTGGENSQKCSWSPNDANQDPQCPIKTLSDAQMRNPNATSIDIGCCIQKGCWSYDNNQSACQNAYGGLCFYDTFGGWCNAKWCSEVTNEENCTALRNQLMMPCEWNISGTGLCEEVGYGGFEFFNDTDSCLEAGGWINATGNCVMPFGGSMGGGEGGFMFAQKVNCFFADNQQNICNNITGCAYCEAGNGTNGVENSSLENACYNLPVGYCEGHDICGPQGFTNIDNSISINCSHIKLKSACNYGPLPNCIWENSSATTGSHCDVGTSSQQKSVPPVQYCEAPLSKNNYTLCMQLAQTYLMPCKWDNSSYPIKNCTFNEKAVFGFGEDNDFELIGSESSCIAVGGSWNSEFYVEEGMLKQDGWCEMTGFFNIDDGVGMGNKGNCDTSCWACEFQSNGTKWTNTSVAQSSCQGSALGYCVWKTDSNAFNKQGWCDYPKEMEFGGAGDCNANCGDCDFMSNPLQACQNSFANDGNGCKWVNDSQNPQGGYCVDKTKKTCDTDCFSCYEPITCTTSNLNCQWDDTSSLCKPQGYDGEVCFDGVDNDNDGMADCSDPDCGFDNFCGGASFGGDCFQYTDNTSCNSAPAFDGMNCTWMNDTWNPIGWCDMPGSNCWQFDNDLTACSAEPGCTNLSDFSGSVCDINITRMDNANCWQYDGNVSGCNSANDCIWVNDSYNASMGWCDYFAWGECMNLNSTQCASNSNCTWNQDNYSMEEGWCNAACFNWSIQNSTECSNAGDPGLCEWRNMSETCQPSTFMFFGGGGGTGCWQFNGNETACNEKDITCVYETDPYANNNVSESEPSGWCMDKAEYEHFGDVKGEIIFLADDSDNFAGGPPQAEPGVNGAVDIIGMGMRVGDGEFNFGVNIFNISKSILCNGYMIGNDMDPFSQKILGEGNKSGRFYWYLDTDGINTGNCNAIGGAYNESGYEFLIKYIGRNTSEGIVETKQLMRCINGTWAATNTLVTTSKKLSCGDIGGVMIAVEKQGLETFSEYNKTALMKVFMASANESGSRENPSDYVGPGYYYPGTIDFGFVDCSDPDIKNPKCKNMQKFGFNVFEECMNGVDDDENGLVDCNDPMCKFMPICGSAFNFSIDTTDKTPPIVMFSEVEALSDMAFVRTDTNEPSNLSLIFYNNDSTCITKNTTLYDVGSGFQANANFKPFHNVDISIDNLGYALTNGTSYYYKIKACDPSGNCAVSACSNFTTKTSSQAKEFIFKIELPGGYTIDIPAMNKTDYNFTENFGGVDYDVGIKTNTTITKNMNFTIHCGDMSIGFFGINILNPTKIDLTNAFICDSVDDLIGMNSSLKKWNKLINDLKLGGALDYLIITIPVAYSTSNTFSWTDDDGANGQDVDDYVECTGTSSYTSCKIPVSMGFSAYTVDVPINNNPNDPGSSGPGAGGSVTTGVLFIPSDEEFVKGYSQNLSTGDRIQISVSEESHLVTLDSIIGNSVKINITSELQQATLNIGQEKMFEVTGDDYYDISVKLEEITAESETAKITVKYAHDKIPEDAGISGDVIINPDTTKTQTGGLPATGNLTWLWILLGIITVIIVAIITVVVSQVKFKNKK